MNHLTVSLMISDEHFKKELKAQLSQFHSIQIKTIYSNIAELIDYTLTEHPNILFIQSSKQIELELILGITTLPYITVLITDTATFNLHYLHRGFFEIMDNVFSPETLFLIMQKIFRFTGHLNQHQTPKTDTLHIKEPPQEYNSTTKNTNKDYMFITCQKKKLKIIFNDIYYFSKVGSAIKIISDDSKSIYYNSTLAQFYTRLPSDIFSRINASTIININKVTEIQKNKAIVKGEEFSITRQYQKEFYAKLKG